ncbi:zinc knuckle CX2CX4HX4C containing protein [Tanacetum coccineum]
MMTKVISSTNVVGDMPVPFSENIILNPGGNVSSEPRIDIRKSGNGDVSGMVWPSLNEATRKDKGSNGVGNNDMDTDMSNGASGSKPLSFVSTMQGLSASGNKRSIEGMTMILKMAFWLNYASMYGKAYGRASFARVLVEVDATKELADSIEVCYSSMGKSMKLRVEYAWKPPLCTHCRVFGHDFKNCNVRQSTEEKRNERVNYKKQDVSNGVDESLEVNEGWQNVRRPVRNVASTSNNIGQQNVVGNDGGYRGGYNVRGRGGMYGKGNMNGRGGLSGGRGGMYQRENNGGTGTRFVPVRNAGKRVDSVHVMEDNGVGRSADKGKETEKAKNGSVKKVIERDEVRVNNSFSVLSNEGFEIGGDEWVQVRSKIDFRCCVRKSFVRLLNSWSVDMKSKRWWMGLWRLTSQVMHFLVMKYGYKVLMSLLFLVGLLPWAEGSYGKDLKKRRDPNNGILKKLDRVMGNGKFVDAYVNAFANFLPFGVSDHSPTVLVFPEVKNVVYPIEDHENLFTKKLDPETAEELVIPVSDDETKKTLFDIEDNNGVLYMVQSVLLLCSVRVLDDFCLCSGLLPKGVLPIKYLGVPMVSKRITDRDCKVMVEVIRKMSGGIGEINPSLLLEVTMSVPNLRSDVEDKTVWIDKRGKEKRFSVREVWKAIRIDCPKVIWYRHVWFSQCIPRHAFILWVDIKGRLKTLDRISRWVNTQSMVFFFSAFLIKFQSGLLLDWFAGYVKLWLLLDGFEVLVVLIGFLLAGLSM